MDPLPNQPPAPAPEAARRGTGPRRLRWAVNAWLVLHLSAVIIAPASVAPSSELVHNIWELFHPYLEALYLNHGYHFFAPEPAQSTLLAFAAERADGTVIRGRIPNFDIQPRLLYHRHFMLTEQMTVPEEFQERLYDSYAKHLAHKYGAERVRLTKVTHWLPTMAMVRDGIKLDDPRSYQEEQLGTYQR